MRLSSAAVAGTRFRVKRIKFSPNAKDTTLKPKNLKSKSTPEGRSPKPQIRHCHVHLMHGWMPLISMFPRDVGLFVRPVAQRLHVPI